MKRQELDAEFKRLEHQIMEIRENTENIPGGCYHSAVKRSAFQSAAALSTA